MRQQSPPSHRQIESIRKSGAKKIGEISKLFINKMNPASTSPNRCAYHSDAQGQKYKQTLPSPGGQNSAFKDPSVFAAASDVDNTSLVDLLAVKRGHGIMCFDLLQ